MPLVTDAVFHTPPPWFTTVPHVRASSVTVAATFTTRDTVYVCVAPAGRVPVASAPVPAQAKFRTKVPPPSGTGSDAAHAPPVTPAGSAAAVSLRL